MYEYIYKSQLKMGLIKIIFYNWDNNIIKFKFLLKYTDLVSFKLPMVTFFKIALMKV